MDEDNCNTIVAEERAYTVWEHDEKNRILRMTDERRKQEAWNRLFTRMEPSLIPY